MVRGTLGLTMAFFLAGLVPLFLLQLDHLGEAWQGRIEIRVFIGDAVPEETIQRLQMEWRLWPEIQQIQWTTRDQALDRLTQSGVWKKDPDQIRSVIQRLGSNPLPHLLTLSLREDFRNITGVQKVSDRLHRIPQVTEVLYDDAGIQRLDRYSQGIWKLWVLGGGIGLGVLFILVTVSLGSSAQRAGELREPGPLLMTLRAGVLGITGAGLSMALLWGLQLALSAQMPMSDLSGLSESHWVFFPWFTIGLWILLGGGLGCIGGLMGARIGRR